MKETFNNLKQVYKFGKPYRKNLIIFSIMSLTFIIINIIFPIIGAKQLIYLTGNLYDQLIFATLFIFGLEVIASINHWILRRNTQVFFRGTTKNIQIKTAKELLKVELSSIEKESSGTFIQRIGSDTDELSKIFTRGMGILTSTITDIGIFVAIFIISKIIFVYFLIGTIILTIIHLNKANKMNEKDKHYRYQREKTGGLIAELVRGIRDIKMLNASNSFVLEIDNNIDKLTKSQFALRNTEMNYNLLSEIIYSIIQFILVILMIILLKNDLLSISAAIIIYNYRTRILSNLITNIGDLLIEVKSFNLSSKRVFSLLNETEFKKEKFGSKHISKIRGNFEFKDVTFKYDRNIILNHLSFKINENETVAFVGKSGAGKTTIFSLLCKLYDISEGQILIDGYDINDLDEYSIRNNITIISQNPYIFNMSIKDNLRLIKSDVTLKEIKKACKLACLDEFIESLPDKYDTVVGEGGITLSGGQRQRLAIARAFIQNTKIILFDEATSALDNETQLSIQKAINNLKGEYTILIIAHRLSTIVDCEKIMLIDDGAIKAVGNHQELIKNNEIYKKLYEKEII